jgi:PAS domain S-box-containing protein
MHKLYPFYFARTITSISRVLAGLVIFIGIAGSVGWIFDIYFLRGIIPNASTMRVNTAICLILSGVCMFNILNSRLLIRCMAIVVSLVGLFTLSEYIFDLDLGIDELFYPEKDFISDNGQPGRMSFITATSFLLTGMVILCYTRQNALYKTAQFFSTIIFFIGLAPLMGYIFGEGLYGNASMYTQMAFPTAFAFICLGLAFLTKFPDKGYVAVLNGTYLGNSFARIIFVLSTIVPALLSGVLILLNEQGYKASYLTIFFCCMAYALTTIIVTYKHLVKINQADAQRLQLMADIEAKNKELASKNTELAATCKELSSTNQELVVSNDQLEVLNSKLKNANYEIERLSQTALEAIENKYRHLTESISDIFFALDHEMKFTYWNKASEISSGGLKAEQVIGKSLYELFPGLRGSAPEKCYIEALRTGEFQKCIYDTSYGNTTHIYDVNIYPYEEGLTVFIKDITQKKMAEAQLSELQSRFESIISSAMDAIITTDESRNIIMFNHAAEKMFGYKADEVLGKSIHIIIPQPLYQSDYTAVDLMNLVDISSEDKGKMLYGLRSDGSEFPVEASVSELSLQEKHYFTVILRDITLRKKAEQQEKQLNNELICQNQQLQQFGYITSHNLRAPIANILGLTQIFNSSNPVDPINQIAIENIKKATVKLDDIIKDLNEILAYQKAINTSKEWISLPDVLNDVSITIAQHIEDSNTCIIADFSTLKDIFSVKSYMNSIFQNMLTNAIKYRRPNVTPQICVTTTEVENYVCLAFTDNGMGIDLEKNKEKLFGMYKRFHIHVEGKGLGLHLVKTQVEALNGRIEVESMLGEGTSFKIYLPKERAE